MENAAKLIHVLHKALGKDGSVWIDHYSNWFYFSKSYTVVELEDALEIIVVQLLHFKNDQSKTPNTHQFSQVYLVSWIIAHFFFSNHNANNDPELQEKFKSYYFLKTNQKNSLRLESDGVQNLCEVLIMKILFTPVHLSVHSLDRIVKGNQWEWGTQDLRLWNSECPERIDKSIEKWLNRKSCEVQDLMLQRENSQLSRNLAIQNYSAPKRAELLPFQKRYHRCVPHCQEYGYSLMVTQKHYFS